MCGWQNSFCLTCVVISRLSLQLRNFLFSQSKTSCVQRKKVMCYVFGNIVWAGRNIDWIVTSDWSQKMCCVNWAFTFLFVPSIVLQLCNVNQQNSLFQIKFQFNSSSLLYVSNILWLSSGRLYSIVHAALYVMFFVYFLKNSSRLEDVLRAQTPCCWSRLPRGVRSRAVADLLLGLRVPIPPAEWMSVSCDYCVLSVRVPLEELIPRQEESYRVCVVTECDQVQQ